MLCLLDFFFLSLCLFDLPPSEFSYPSVFFSCGRNLNSDVHTTCARLLFSAAREMRSLQDATCSRAIPAQGEELDRLVKDNEEQPHSWNLLPDCLLLFDWGFPCGDLHTWSVSHCP